MSRSVPAASKDVEVWENVFGGLDRRMCRDTTGVVLDTLRHVLPAPVISPTCAKKGHLWSLPTIPLARETVVRGCVRCARRGLVVCQSTGSVS